MRAKIKKKGNNKFELTVSIDNHLEMVAVSRVGMLNPSDITEEERFNIENYSTCKGVDYKDLLKSMKDFFDEIYFEVNYGECGYES